MMCSFDSVMKVSSCEVLSYLAGRSCLYRVSCSLKIMTGQIQSHNFSFLAVYVWTEQPLSLSLMFVNPFRHTITSVQCQKRDSKNRFN